MIICTVCTNRIALVLSGSWWFLVVLGGSWWFLVVLACSCDLFEVATLSPGGNERRRGGQTENDAETAE